MHRAKGLLEAVIMLSHVRPPPAPPRPDGRGGDACADVQRTRSWRKPASRSTPLKGPVARPTSKPTSCLLVDGRPRDDETFARIAPIGAYDVPHGDFSDGGRGLHEAAGDERPPAASSTICACRLVDGLAFSGRLERE